MSGLNGFVHGTGGDYGHDLGGYFNDDDGYGEGPHGEAGPWAYNTDGGDARKDWSAGPSS